MLTATYLILKKSIRTNEVVEYVFADMRIHGTKWVVKEIDVRISID